MINKAELIRKIIKLSGIEVSDAKTFFEIFLSKIAAYLKPGEALKINEVGVFLLKNRIKKNADEELNNNLSNLYLAYYTPESWREFYLTTEKAFSNDNGNLIFNIPNNIFSLTSPIDSYFSLSFGKPVIPLNINSYQPEVSVSPAEIKKEYEIFANKIISRGELIDNSIINSFVAVPSLKTETENVNIKYESQYDEVEEQESVSWDFGGDLEREIQEEEILDVEVNENDLPKFQKDFTDKYELAEEESDSMSWDFGAEEIEEIEGYESSIEEEVKEEEIIKKDERGEYEQVKSLTAEIKESSLLQNDPQGESSIWNSYANDSTAEKVSEEKVKEEDEEIDFSKTVDADYKEYFKGKASARFTPVNDFKKDESEESDEDDDLPFIKRKDGIIELQPRHIREERKAEKQQQKEFSLFSSSQKNQEEIAEAPQPAEAPKAPQLRLHIESDKKTEIKSSFSEKFFINKKPTPFTWKMVSGFIILMMTYFIYQNMQTDQPSKIITSLLPQKKIKVNTQVIERDFEIPVTYPYEPKAVMNFVPDNLVIKYASIGAKENIVETMPETRESNETNFTPPITDEENSALLFSKENPDNKLNQKGAVPKSEDKKTTTVVEQKSQIAKLSESGIIPDDTETAVVNNVFYDGSKYSVQVSSWPNQNTAVNEMERFKKMGYSAYIVKAFVASRNRIFYRVRVGGFNTVAEAQAFNKR